MGLTLIPRGLTLLAGGCRYYTSRGERIEKWCDECLLTHWSQVKDFIKMSRPLNTGWLLLASGLTGALQNPQ